jgi:Protein of unknown function (DUF2927)
MALAVLGPATAEDRQISVRQAVERKNFSDADIVRGFFKVAFGAELGLGGPSERIRKYDRPVRVFVENRAKPDREAAIAEIVADIGSRIANLEIEMTKQREEANFVVRLVRNRDLARVVREIYGRKAGSIVRRLEPQCLSGLSKDPDFRILSSNVILVVDAGDFVFRACAYEEILQALGPIRDDRTIPWTMFNDDVRMGFFGIYDQYLLNILYHPSIRAGMTRRQVKALLPEIMPSVRVFVAQTNGL